MRVWCLYVSAGIFPFKLPFRYSQSATNIKIWFQKEKMCNKMLFLCNFVNDFKFQVSLRLNFAQFYLFI
ncbi:hypothetical protein AL515_09150 [Citrobacter sp. FDAARGOS_156]|nr:hypothetical protein AL515_09150 [Citrobacter sp. FDAARGOS_156]